MRMIREFVIILIALLAVIYLVNPTAGILELILDNFPLIGNLDEAGATLILVNTLAYYGLDLSKLLGARSNQLSKRNDN